MTTPLSRRFRITRAVTLLVLFVGILPTLVGLVVVWLPGDLPKRMFADDIADHRFHAAVISVTTWLLFLCVATQMRNPRQKTAAMLMAVVAMVSFLPASVFAPTFSPLEPVVLLLLLAMWWLHPARSVRGWRPVHPAGIAVWVVGAVPWLLYAWHQLRLQFDMPPDSRHVELVHFGFMVSAVVVILFAALIGATSLPGARQVAAFAALAAAGFGVIAVVAPHLVSSPGVTGGLGALAWAIGVGWVTAVRTLDERPMPVAPAGAKVAG